jgi:signal transduction histidine kinase
LIRLGILKTDRRSEFSVIVGLRVPGVVYSFSKTRLELFKNCIPNLVRFMSLTNKDALKDKEELSIKIRADAEKGVLHITDTGIGMACFVKHCLANKTSSLATCFFILLIVL